MRKLLSLVALCLMATVLYAQDNTNNCAQEKDVTKFLGIPVDGTREEMARKLVEKGFTPSLHQGKTCWDGEFLGEPVHLFIRTAYGKVWRIAVLDSTFRDAGQIRVRYNELAARYGNNEKYIASTQYFIPEDEDLDYQMTRKRYEAKFFQQGEEVDTVGFHEWSAEYVRQMHSDVIVDWDNLSESYRAQLSSTVWKAWLVRKNSHKAVWFDIASLDRNKHRIVLYYDNKLNNKQGEDL